MALFPWACGEKKLVTSSSKNVRPRGAEVLRIGSQIKLAADDAGFELHRPISAIAETLQDRAQVGEEEDIDRRVSRQGLLQSQISGLIAKISSLQTLERFAAAVEDISSGFQVRRQHAQSGRDD